MGERFNYVALSGAHQLNMTRAFGDFGHKEWRGSKPVRTHRPSLTGQRVCTVLSLSAAERFLLGLLSSLLQSCAFAGP